jgi:hypothetical protein
VPKGAENVLVEIVQFLVPYHCESDRIADIRARIAGRDIRMAAIPCALEMVAEIYMAATDERPTEYESRRNEGHFPRGTRHRPAPPISGLKRKRDLVEAIQSDLNGKFAVGNWSSIRSRIDDVVIASLAATPGLPDMRPEQKIKFAAKALEINSRSARYYLTFRRPKDPGAWQEMERGLMELASDYKALVILELTGDDEQAVEDCVRFGDFNYMLPTDASDRESST